MAFLKFYVEIMVNNWRLKLPKGWNQEETNAATRNHKIYLSLIGMEAQFMPKNLLE